jgi:hypothetical protein
MFRENKPIHEGPNWVPWVGLGLVLPAVIVFLVSIFGFLASTERGPSGRLHLGESVGASGFGGGLVAAVAAVIGLILGVLGLVRASRRKLPRDGSNLRIAGSVLDIGVIVLAVLGLASLAWFAI